MRYDPIGQVSVRIWPAGTARVAMAGTTVAVDSASHLAVDRLAGHAEEGRRVPRPQLPVRS